jgi:hypothetical protein
MFFVENLLLESLIKRLIITLSPFYITKNGETEMKDGKIHSTRKANKSAVANLIGQVIDPARIEVGWNCEEEGDGYEFIGTVDCNQRLNSKDLLKHGVFQIGGRDDIPVILHATVRTDSIYRISSIEIDAYASNGPQYGKPIYVEVTTEVEALVVKEIGRFLAVPILADGKIFEDKPWLEQLIPQFEEMSSCGFQMKEELPKYHGKTVDFEKARENGWIISQNETCCSGHFQLITDCEGYSFWLGLYVKTDKHQKIKSLKCVLNENKPPPENLIRSRAAHDMVEGFNFARLVRFLDTITHYV